MKLSETDHGRIAAAVAAAERSTSGEIRCVLADRRDPLKLALAAATCALVLPGIALVLGLRPTDLVGVTGGWTVTDPSPELGLTIYVALQAVVFVLALGIGLSPLSRILTPEPWKAASVRRAAEAQFEALGLTHTLDRTGVLLYVSLAHRRAEVLADRGIYDKAPTQAWDDVVGLLVAGLRRGAAADGFVDAVTRTGEILAAYLPPRGDDRNELPDSVVETR